MPGLKSDSPTGDLYLKWNPDNLQIRTRTVERTLAPLVTQVTTLVNSSDGRSTRRLGRTVKKAQVLIAAVEKAIENFLEKGEQMISDNPGGEQELREALDVVKTTGNDMIVASRDFVKDPTSSSLRATVIKAARALLSSVTRLLIVADMIDVHLLIRHMKDTRRVLEQLNKANSQQEVIDNFDRLQKELERLNMESNRRATDLRDPEQAENLQAARALLKTTCPMLHSACKAFVRHPEVDPARLNRDFAFGEMNDALEDMENVLEGQQIARKIGLSQGQLGELAAALNKFEQSVFIDPQCYNAKVRPSLEEQLERIISGAALIADSEFTRDDRKNRIVQECNAVRQALQDLLAEYERNAGQKETSENLDLALVHVGQKTKDLRRHLRRAVIDHVSDNFMDTQVPLEALIEAARRGDQKAVETLGTEFLEHSRRLTEVAHLSCTMSNNSEGLKMVRYAALLAMRPQSKPAQDNMMAFKEAWEEKVRLLTLAVDSIVTLDDFLAVSEAHIVEDVKACIQALVEKDVEQFDHSAGAIRGRTIRVCKIVDGDMEMRPADPYAEKVKSAVHVVRNEVLSKFSKRAEFAIHQMGTSTTNGGVDEAEMDDFIDAASAVHKGIQDIRHALLMNRDPGDIDSDEEYEYAPSEKSSHITSASGGGGGTSSERAAKASENQRALMRQLPEEDKRKIQEQIDVFKVVAKWDESGNDIIALAKYMCMIMLDMTDFTRGRGPLRTTMDVINAAKKISEAGTKLNALAAQIANECVESETKKDLLAYLQRITLYCHQLNITSRVKADVQQVGDQLIANALESATSLIQSAKNLLNAVVLTVKAAYIANTKYPRKKARESSLVVWKMCPPNKQPLVRHEQKPHGIIRRASQLRDLQPMKVLSEFSSGDDAV
ncbi:unnamed protein product [Soboliphyme baturini]|uniref:Catenin alpha-2 n=1 Tax=Soboliphyme baturini TaxID=241478 RepID=A0A183ILV7_9BILA|nr:unnamed protein product [Soboliphyme baturini]